MPQRGTWRARLQALGRNVGEGDLAGTYWVDQRYAAYQHVHEWLKHPRGGGPNYVSIPLAARHREWFRDIARGLLDGSAAARMAGAMGDLDGQVRVLAPVDENDLRRSGQYVVTDGDAVVVQQAPDVARLSEAQLRAKKRGRR